MSSHLVTNSARDHAEFRIPLSYEEFVTMTHQLTSVGTFANNNFLPAGTFHPEMEPLGLTPRMMQGTSAIPAPTNPAASQLGGRQVWAGSAPQMQGVGSTALMSGSGFYSQGCRSSSPVLNNFTFTSPTATQCNSVLPPFQPVYSQALAAPGMGVSWQHAVPKQMPWMQESCAVRPEMVHFSGLPVGIPAMSQSLKFQGEHSALVSSGCHRTLKRPAEKSLQEPPTKIYVSEEKMAAELQGLYITDPGFPSLQGSGSLKPSQNAGSAAPSASGQEDWPTPNQKPLGQEKMWERFKELEERLAESSDGEEDAMEVKKDGVLKLLCDTINTPLKSSKTLPNFFALDESKKREQSMQLVLWKPSPLSSILTPGSSSSEEDEDNPALSHSGSSATLASSQSVESTDAMDIDLMEDCLDL